MIKNRIRCTGLAGAAVLASAVYGQNVMFDTAGGGGEVNFSYKMIAERGGEEQSIAGAPYSADQSTTTTQVLPDGNRIVHNSSAKIYRDDKGRTRVEHSLDNIGSLGSEKPHTMVMINDPVAGTHYNLQPEKHSAWKALAMEPPGMDGRHAEKMAAEKAHGTVSISGTIGAAVSAGGTMTATEGAPGFFIYRDTSPVELKTNKESLGDQTMEGLKVTGTRITHTIPAGAEGNELPMQIVDEQWYSADLHTTLKSIHSDPRMGQTVFTVSNVSRTNPDASLFTIPSDYQVTEGPAFHKMMIHPPGAPPAE